MEVIRYDALPAFRPFHESTASEVALIGGYGSGKSRALVAEALKMGLTYAGSEHLIARKTIPSLRDTTEADFLDQLPPAFLDACKVQRGGGHVQTLYLPNGSKYYFKGLDDWRKIKSLNLMGVWVDEADEIDEETYDGLKSRLRQVEPRPVAAAAGAGRIPFQIVRLACNPAGKNWIWRLFVKEPTRDRVGYISTSLDNPYNPRSYIDRLLAYPEAWVRRYVFCSFDDFEGTIYPAWDSRTHMIEPYGEGAYEADGWFVMGMDPGTAHPTAAVWCYYDQRRHAYVAVAEHAEIGMDATSHAAAWQNIERHGTSNLARRPGAMNVTRRIADPTIATRDRGTMMSLERQYAKKGFYFEHGPREIPARMPMLGELIHLRQFLVTKECEELYWQLKNYRYEDLTPAQRERGNEAKPLKKDVDLVDAAQYIASRATADYTIRPDEPDEPDEFTVAQQLWREQSEGIARHAADRVHGRVHARPTAGVRGLV